MHIWNYGSVAIENDLAVMIVPVLLVLVFLSEYNDTIANYIVTRPHDIIFILAALGPMRRPALWPILWTKLCRNEHTCQSI